MRCLKLEMQGTTRRSAVKLSPAISSSEAAQWEQRAHRGSSRGCGTASLDHSQFHRGALVPLLLARTMNELATLTLFGRVRRHAKACREQRGREQRRSDGYNGPERSGNLVRCSRRGGAHGLLVGTAEVRVHCGGNTAALVDGPNHERLAAAAVASGKHSGAAGDVLAIWRLDVAALVSFELERVDECAFGAQEAHGHEHKVCRDLLLGTGDLFERTAIELELAGHERLDLPILVAEQLLRAYGVLARIVPKHFGRLLVAVVDAVDLGPEWPRVCRGVAHRRAVRHKLQVHH
mmetsp:Transcript_21881/g.69891  ORF Transcript_21881/g.69891 Transcript_21881/m.69891 type:complete len:292 (-) Transcript_21881:232-1107(-)